MKLSQMLDVLHTPLELSDNEELRDALELIIQVESLSGGSIDCLIAAFKRGPLYDGNVPSKAGRDVLLEYGMMSKVVVNGEDGYNACTYRGADAFRLLTAMNQVTPEMPLPQVPSRIRKKAE